MFNIVSKKGWVKEERKYKVGFIFKLMHFGKCWIWTKQSWSFILKMLPTLDFVILHGKFATHLPFFVEFERHQGPQLCILIQLWFKIQPPVIFFCGQCTHCFLIWDLTETPHWTQSHINQPLKQLVRLIYFSHWHANNVSTVRLLWNQLLEK